MPYSAYQECLVRDNSTCQHCGSNEQLEIHHRDRKGVKEYGSEVANDDLDNLITLCLSCHHHEHKRLRWVSNGRKSILDITSGVALGYFPTNESIIVNYTEYTVLTGYESSTHRCFWCGALLKGKLKRYCRGHMKEYYNHFNWGYASFEALKRADHKCENCGCIETYDKHDNKTNLRVHHIVPLKGAKRFFSAFNVPWNLIVLCHKCHLEVHNIMRPPKLNNNNIPDSWEEAKRIGQSILPIEIVTISNKESL